MTSLLTGTSTDMNVSRVTNQQLKTHLNVLFFSGSLLCLFLHFLFYKVRLTTGRLKAAPPCFHLQFSIPIRVTAKT